MRLRVARFVGSLFHRVAGAAFWAAVLLVPSVGKASPVVGQKAPEFTATTFDREKIKSADFDGKVVILNFWATWCVPCRQEMPILDEYARTHPDLKILAVATEDSVPDSFLKPLSKAVSFKLVSQISGGGYGILGGVPTSYVIDRSGVLRYARAASFNEMSLDATVGPLLDAFTPPPGQQVAALSAAPTFEVPDPVWTSRPSGQELGGLLPAKALREGVTGQTNVRCLVTQGSALTDCAVIAETPKGFGFGRSAIQAARSFKIRDTSASGRPVAGGTVTIPMKWSVTPAAPGDDAQTAEGGHPIDWRLRPSAAEMAAAYPAGAAGLGHVILLCTAAAGGGLTQCSPTVDSPPRRGFAQAAMQLVGRFAMAAEPTSPQPGSQVLVPLTFYPPTDALWDEDGPFKARGLKPVPPGGKLFDGLPRGDDLAFFYPDAARGSHKEGGAKIGCVVNGEGRLTDCLVLEEDPYGLGFGDAVVKLAAKFRLKPVASDGLATSGRFFDTTIRW